MHRAELLIKSLLPPVLNKLDITDYTIEINAGSATGDGYLGDIFSVKVKHNGGDTDLIVKTAPRDKQLRELLRADLVFRNEIVYYTEVFPEMDSLQKERQIQHPLEFTNYYTSSLKRGEETLVLQNLKTAGYRLCDRRKPFDAPHLVLVLNYYAKLHALSFALRSQRPEVFERLANSLLNVLPVIYPSYIDGIKQLMRRNANMLKRRGLGKESASAEKIANEAELILYLQNVPADESCVLLHGDCWSNNLLFKYDVRVSRVNGNVVKVMF